MTARSLPNDDGLCAEFRDLIAQAREGLEANPTTVDAVGDPVTDIIIGFEKGCSI